MFASVTRQLKRAMSAVKSVLALAGTAAAALDPRLESYLPEGERIDGVESLLLALVGWIQGDHDRLEEHEARQRRALRQLQKLRQQRDRKRGPLYGMLLRLRTTFDHAFGQGNAAVYLGLGPRMSKLEPVALRRLARETVTILSDPELVTPAPKVLGLWENPTRYAEQIEELLTPFHTALDAIEAQKREVERAQKAKTDLLAELRDRLKWSIHVFEGMYHLAGLGFHADRLRLKVSSRPNAEEKAEESGGGEETGAGSAEPAASSEASDSAAGG